MFQLPREDVCQRATRGSGAFAPIVSWHIARIMTRNVFSSWAQLRKLSSAVILWTFAKPSTPFLLKRSLGP